MMEKGDKIIGTLVPVFSLRSSKQSSADQGTFATGVLFLDWLQRTSQNAWQILPLHETQLEKGSTIKHVPSPYKSYGVGLDPRYLSTAFKNIKPTVQEKEYFLRTHKDWIEDYALFCALRDHFGTDDWQTWDGDIRKRNQQSIHEWKSKLDEKIEKNILLQWQLHQSFAVMKKKAQTLGISLIGDLPFYVSHNSPLVWAHQDIFLLNDGRMEFVSGIPNTPGTHFGRQIWGHPLYNWQAREKVLAFWNMRLLYQSELYDRIRIDHAKAFFAYGAMDLDHEENDRYKDGPGADFFHALLTFSKDHDLAIFVEDSGDKTQELRAYLATAAIPGLKIFWFAYQKDHLNAKYAEVGNYPKNCVAYTTTHDTEPLIGYLQSLHAEQKQEIATAAQVSYDDNDLVFAANLRNAIISSSAETVIIPIQDWLLTNDRINIPGTEKEIDDPNWHYLVSKTVEDLPTQF